MRPVFIGGCHRSGTTLLGSMLGAHSDCLCVPESHFKVAALSAHLARGTTGASRVLDAISKDWRFRLWEVDIPSASVFEGELGGSCAGLIEWIVSRYGERVGKPAPRIWVDHTPSNVRHAATLLEAFPDAQMIHIVRDGRAVAASLLPLDWGPNRIDRAAHLWVEMVGHGLAAEAHWGAARVARVRYEDLVQEPHAALARLCAFSRSRIPGQDAESGRVQGSGVHPRAAPAGGNPARSRACGRVADSAPSAADRDLRIRSEGLPPLLRVCAPLRAPREADEPVGARPVVVDPTPSTGAGESGPSRPETIPCPGRAPLSPHSGLSPSLRMPRVSVIIPAFNAEATTLETVRSVQAQTLSDFELIVIDDGSTDGTRERLAAVTDSRLQVHAYGNGGLPTARNRGIALATGEFVAFLDADDRWTPDKLQSQVAALEARADAGVAYRLDALR